MIFVKIVMMVLIFNNNDETRPELLQGAEPAGLVSPPHQLHTPWIRYLSDIFEISNVIFGHFDTMTNMALIITTTTNVK